MTDFAPPIVDEPTPVDEAYNAAAEAIGSGLLDDRLDKLYGIVVARADARGEARHWRCYWAGYELHDSDITLDEGLALEARLKRPLAIINPAVTDARVQIVTLILERQGMTYEKARAEAGKASAAATAEALSFYIGEPPPLPVRSGPPFTSSPAGSNGRPRKSGAARSAKSRG